jgi:hypothetical protein
MRKLIFLISTALSLAIGASAPLLAGDGLATGSFDQAAAASGKAYVFRAIGGKFASVEMDHLADQIRATGVEAQVYSYIDWQRPAATAIARYRQEERKSPIIAIGHSAGGDSAIRFAEVLRHADVPVSLVVTFDPTRLATRVPSNVARFINIYQSLNMVGGGDPLPGADFHGHYASIDLKKYWTVPHVYLPRITGIEAGVVAKVVEVTAPAAAAADPATLPIEYVVPRDQPIELWDCGLPVIADEGDTAASVAEKYAVPVWAVAALNKLDPAKPLAPGQRLIIPRYLAQAMPPPVALKPVALKKTAKAK